MSSRVRASFLLAGVGILGLACAEYIAAPGERVPRGLLLDSLQYTVDEGQKLNVVATVLDQAGAPFDTLPPGVAVAWNSSDTTVAKVDTAGVLSGITAGATQVNAAVSGAFGTFKVSAPVTVRPLVNAIAEVAGDSQSGTVGQALPTRLQVRVTNRLGAGVGRIVVNFTVLGGGAGSGGGAVDTASTTTDSTGLATAGLTLGTRAGKDTVQASTPRLLGTVVTFVATANPGPISALAKVSGDSQLAGGGAALAAPLVARGLDRYGNGVPGVTVAWAVASGGGSIVPPSAVTGLQGTASAQWTLGATPGTQTATASVGGALTVTYTAIATAPVASVTVAPASVTLASGATQQFTATPKDSVGNAIPGKTVTWTSSDTGVAKVSATGLATAAKVGTATITATVDGKNGTATMTVTAGPASTVTSQVTVSAPLVLVGKSVTFTLNTKDAAGNLLTGGGLTVAFTTSGGTSAGTLGPVTDLVNGSYTATFTGTTVGTPLTVGATIGGQAVTSTLPTVQVQQDTVVATVTVAPTPVTVAAGATQQLTATPKNAGGTALSGKTVAWTTSDATIATVSATGLVTAVKVGAATITATADTKSGTASVTVTPGPASTSQSVVTVSAGTVTVGGAVTLKLTTRDAAGDSLTAGGRTVVFTQSGGTSAGTIGAVTDAGNGTYTATFTATTAGTPVSIGATIDGQAVTSTPAPTIQVNAAVNNLVHWINAAGGAWATAANWNPARVPTLQDTAVVDAAGTYSVSSSGDSVGGVVVGNAGGSSVSVLFNGASKVRGNVEVRAGADLDAAATVIVGSFRNDGEIDVEKGAALAVDTTGAATAQNYGAMYLVDSSVVNVTRAPAGLVNHGLLNPGGPPVEGAIIVGLATIAGNVTLGSGSVVNIPLRGAAFRQYSVLGITGAATLGDTLVVELSGGFVPSVGQTFVVVTWTSFSGAFSRVQLPTLVGAQWQVSYTPVGLMLTVMAGPAASVSAYQGDGQTAAAGSALPTPPAVRVTDAGGNGVAGKSVTFAVTSGGGSVIAPATVTTDANGVATAGGWQLGATPGTNTMTATVAASGLAGNPVTFTATGTTPSLTWTGAVSTDWSNPNNWSPALVPVATGDVFIGPATNEPVLTAASAAQNVTIQGSGAVLTINGQTLTAASLVTNNAGILLMTNAADVVDVSGNAWFFGGNENGGLTAGELRFGGSFNQNIGTSNSSFAPSGTHRTVLTGTTLQTVTFVDLTGASYFHDLDLSRSAGINIQSDPQGVLVKGALISKPTGAATPMLYGLGRSLTARQLQVSRLVVDDAALIVNEGGTALSQQFDSVTFQNFRYVIGFTIRTQLTLTLQGASPSPRLLTFNGLSFVPLSTGSSGDYLNVTSNGGATTLTINGSNLTNGPAFTVTSANATVVWQ